MNITRRVLFLACCRQSILCLRHKWRHAR